jgi:hypothetical protein
MIKKYLLILLLFSGCILQAQEVFFTGGKNFTKYDYKNSFGVSNPNLRSGDGSFYQLGMAYNLNIFRTSDEFSYAVSLVYNQLNAVGGSRVSNYAWNTNYVGIQNELNYILYQNYDYFKVKTKLGCATSTIIKGEQYINNVMYDISKNEEFKGLLLQPSIGIDFHYSINRGMEISAGYEFSKAFNVSNTSAEKLSFTNNQIHFGLHFPIY